MAFAYCSCGYGLDTPTPEEDLSEDGPLCPECGRQYHASKSVEEYVLELLSVVEELTVRIEELEKQ
jgi:hypothetical protein